jgi:hypothetical protein
MVCKQGRGGHHEQQGCQDVPRSKTISHETSNEDSYNTKCQVYHAAPESKAKAASSVWVWQNFQEK